MHIPKISVVMSLYNSEKYLAKAIDSVLAQDFTSFEFIIIDDGSSDHSFEIASSYTDPRIHLLQQTNKGLAAALNHAISIANSPLIARMDADDICYPQRLITQYNFLQNNPETIILGSAVTCIDEIGDILADIHMHPLHTKGEYTIPESPCVHPSVMFRHTVFKQVGGYPESMRFGGEDAVLFNKMMRYGAVVNLTETLLFYRLSSSSMSQKSASFNRLLRQRVHKEVQGERISDKEKKQLADAYHSSDQGYGYHLYVAKLFLRHAEKSQQARFHLYQVLRLKFFSLHLWLCLLSSFIPFHWRIWLHTYLKKCRKL